jgi:signal transduction histidine kinase
MRIDEPRARSIAYYLSALVLASLVPMIVIATIFLLQQAENERVELNRRLLDTSRALSLAVDRQMAGYRVMLQSLAEADLVDERNLARLHALASRIAAIQGAELISMFDREGRQLFNTAIRLGEPLPQPFLQRRARTGKSPPVDDTTAIQRVLLTGAAGNSNLFRSLTTGKLLFTVDVPVVRSGVVRYVFNAGVAPESVATLLARSTRFKGTPALIIDGNGLVIARWGERPGTIGWPPESPLLEAIKSAPEGSVEAVSEDKVPMRFAFSRSAETGWIAVTGVERSHYNRERARALWIGLALASLGIGVALAFAVLLAERMRKSAIALALLAQRHDTPANRLRIREFEEVRRALIAAAAIAENEARERENRRVAEVQREEAAAANRQKDQFIAMLSHELRNPLAALNNAVHTTATFGVTQDTLDTMRRQVLQLTRLVEDLLDMSRLSLGKLRFQSELFDLRTALRAAIESTGPARERKRQKLIEQPARSELRVAGDHARLTQVFANLLDNASKFSPEEATITIRSTSERGQALVEVADSGAGIDAEFTESIFTPFAQGPAHGANAGLGIGLGVAKALVQHHRGTITVHSEGAGRGSTFIVRVPLA